MILRPAHEALPRRRRSWGWLAALVLSLVVHAVAVALLLLVDVAAWLFPARPPAARFTPVVLVEDPDVSPPPEEPLPPEPVWNGQIVEIAPPRIEERPDRADYLSRYDTKVEEETRTARVEVNPEVLAPQWSREKQVQSEEIEDLDVKDPRSGATVGNHRFDPHRDGTLASLPSPWEKTNRLGPEAPAAGGASTAALAGAPQNDLLDEKLGDRVGLNSMNYPYASYMERIRRQVNYWWEQNLDNLPSSVRLTKHQYLSGVEVILDGDGRLEHIRVTHPAGVPELDDCVVRAFKLASPFENPPPGLVRPDGRVYLPDFDFTVQLSAAKLQYQGVDPRAGVQFPGILKSPR